MTEGMVELNWKAYNEPGTKGVRRGSPCVGKRKRRGVGGADMNVIWSRSRKGTVYIMRSENRAGSRVWESAGICNTVKNLFASKSNRNH